MNKRELEYLLRLVERDQHELITEGLWDSEVYKEAEHIKTVLREQIKSAKYEATPIHSENEG